MINFYCGVDGGGTSCRARITDKQGQQLGEAKTGSANILLGTDLAWSSINRAISEAAGQAGIPASQFDQIAVGLALAGAEQRSAWHEFMKPPHVYGHVTLNTDAYGALMGAFNGDDGAILIAGTGSCGIVQAAGECSVIGGREFPISDQGGGAIMGLRLIQKTLLAADGLLTITPLAEEVLAHFKHDLDEIVTWSKSARPCDYGQFSPAIFAHANNSDELAVDLLSQTAADIEMWLGGLRKLGANRVCLMGSIGERIVPWLKPPFQQLLVTPAGDAMDGAILMAKGQHNLYAHEEATA